MFGTCATAVTAITVERLPQPQPASSRTKHSRPPPTLTAPTSGESSRHTISFTALPERTHERNAWMGSGMAALSPGGFAEVPDPLAPQLLSEGLLRVYHHFRHVRRRQLLQHLKLGCLPFLLVRDADETVACSTNRTAKLLRPCPPGAV